MSFDKGFGVSAAGIELAVRRGGPTFTPLSGGWFRWNQDHGTGRIRQGRVDLIRSAYAGRVQAIEKEKLDKPPAVEVHKVQAAPAPAELPVVQAPTLPHAVIGADHFATCPHRDCHRPNWCVQGPRVCSGCGRRFIADPPDQVADPPEPRVVDLRTTIQDPKAVMIDTWGDAVCPECKSNNFSVEPGNVECEDCGHRFVAVEVHETDQPAGDM